ncbi:MAG: 50S ribosomal protein L25 [Deltaproteobacteria bacterium]|nr:50S ribosomal protein L25 [Deltaproteobacteria bacterium]
MEQINLLAKSRQETGKGPARRLRNSGLVPAVLYGSGIKGAVSISLNGKELQKVLHTAAGGNVLVSLSVEGDKTRTVMFKDILRHPLKGSIEHVDLLEILMDHKIIVEVPVHITGRAAGLAFGGIVSQDHRKVRVECLPSQIPDSFDVDVTPLGIGQSFHVKDINLPEGLKALDDPDMTIVSVVAPMAEVAPKTAEEVEAELAKSFEEKEEVKKEEEKEKE